MATSEMNLLKLIEELGTEDKCHEYLEALRWPAGVECPRCRNRSISRIAKRRQFECSSCRYQFSVRVGTMFDRSHLPLGKWFMAIYLLGTSKPGISAKQLERTLEVSYKTAWFLAQRVRAAMEGEPTMPLGGKRSVPHTRHEPAKKHSPARADEIAFKVNDPDNPYLFRDTVLRLIDTQPLRYQRLVHPRG